MLSQPGPGRPQCPTRTGRVVGQFPERLRTREMLAAVEPAHKSAPRCRHPVHRRLELLSGETDAEDGAEVVLLDRAIGLLDEVLPRAEPWRWSSLWHRTQATQVPWLSEWPIALPGQWTEHVNKAQTENELAALRRAVVRGVPYGDDAWQEQTAEVLGLQSSLRPPGRPRKPPKNVT